MGILFADQSGSLVYRGSYDPHIVSAIKGLAGRQWNPSTKEWILPLNKETVDIFKQFPRVSVQPNVYSFLHLRQEAEEVVKQIKDIEKPEPAAPMPINVEPFAHQIKAFNIALSLNHVGLLHEQGCGKTLTTIAVIGSRWKQGTVRKVLVVAPLSVIPVWEREVQERATYPFRTVTLDGSMVQREASLAENNGSDEYVTIALTNYEAVWRRGFLEALQRWGADMVVCDESQRIKTPTAKQSRGLHVLGDTTRYRMILTGTPVTATPLDFWSQYRFLDPNVFGKSFYAFRNRYARMGGFQNKQVVGYVNKAELITKAHSIAHRVTKLDALDLPEQIDQNLYCELEPAAERAYKELMEESVMSLESAEGNSRVAVTNVLTRLLRLQQLTGGFLPDDPEAEEPQIIQVSRAKLNLLEETVSEVVNSGKKVVIFCRFVAEIEAIKNLLETSRFDGHGPVEYAMISGAIKQSSRGDEVQRFQSDPACKVFIAQIQTAGLGITLHAADTSIFYSADFNFANYDQCKARLHRIGQRNIVRHIHLVVKGTVDEKIYKSLADKKSVADDVVDNWRSYFS